MSNEEKQELIDFLIYLELSILAWEQSISEKGLRALMSLKLKYPQFENRRDEMNKFINLVKKEK